MGTSVPLEVVGLVSDVGARGAELSADGSEAPIGGRKLSTKMVLTDRVLSPAAEARVSGSVTERTA